MSRPWMPLYVADYLADTAHLRAAESGAYLHLIMHYWQHESLPADDRSLATIAKMTAREWSRARPVIESFFQPGWKHRRIDDEIASAAAAYERRAQAGRRGGRAPRDPPKVSHGTEQCSSNASSTSEAMLKQPQPQKVGGGGDAGARDPDPVPKAAPSDPAFDLAEQVMVIFNIDPKHPPPGWCGAPMRVRCGLAAGWTPEIVLIAARRVAGGKRDGPPGSFAYLEPAIAREHALATAPVPTATVVPPKPETVHAPTANRSLSAAAWRAHDAVNRTVAGDAELRDEAGRAALRIVS